MAIGEFGGAATLLRREQRVVVDADVLVLRDGPCRAQSVARLCRRHASCSSKIRPIRSRTPPTASPSRRRWNCSSARRAAIGRPEWGIDSTHGRRRARCRCTSRRVWERPFCRLLHFERAFERPPRRPQPKLLIVAPMSGHYATLLRGTVEAFLPNHDVYITEWATRAWCRWRKAASISTTTSTTSSRSCIALGGDAHVIAVCQPSVPVLAAVALMEADNDPYVPHSMVLMGGPIDTRINPNAVNKLAEQRGIDWFRSHVITKVPFPHPGFMRDVYPGFLQLHGFMSMNLDRHLEAHRNLFLHLVKGDGDSAQKHREFYDEYLAVMDLAGRVLSADGRYRVHPPRAAERRDDASRPPRRSGGRSRASR